MVHKVVAYITDGDRLLVFSHPHHPEAGIQVPAGTVEENESPREAVLREAQEETGLDDLEIQSYLGVREHDLSAHGQAEIQRQHFFHLVFRGEAPVRWRHYEKHPSKGSAEQIQFELFWVKFPGGVPELTGDQGALLPKLRSAVSPETEPA